MCSGPAPAEPLTWHFVFRFFGTGCDQIEDVRGFVVLAGVGSLGDAAGMWIYRTGGLFAGVDVTGDGFSGRSATLCSVSWSEDDFDILTNTSDNHSFISLFIPLVLNTTHHSNYSSI